MSNDFTFPDPQQPPQPNYSQQYGSYQQPKKKSTSGLTWFLLVCGGCAALVVVCCLCCLGSIFVGVRQPAFIVAFYGGALTNQNGYEGARLFVCEGSQAATYTDDLEADGAYFSAINTNDNLADDGVDATGTIIRNGQSEPWSATIFVADGGTFGRCIERIIEN